MGDLLLFIVQLLAGLSGGNKNATAPIKGMPPALPPSRPPLVPNPTPGAANAQRSSNPRGVMNAPPMRQAPGRGRFGGRPSPARAPVRAPMAAAPVAAPRAAAMSVAPSTTVNRGRSGDAPTVSASAIRKWATPTRLQQQFILTEVFQPPLALRKAEGL